MIDTSKIPPCASLFSRDERLWLLQQYYRCKKQNTDARQQVALLYQLQFERHGFDRQEMGNIKAFLDGASQEYYSYLKGL